MNQVLSYTKEEFEAAVQEEVQKHFSSKEEEVARREAEDALREAKETFETLKASIEAKDAKIVELEEVLTNLDISDPTEAEVAANEKLVELEAQLEEYKSKAEVAEAALETLAREETATSRMAELEEDGVSLEGDDAQVQYTKVRDLSDEEFNSYKSELVALKNKYASTSEEEEEVVEIAELSEQEIAAIAQSLGCDPADSKCISLVNDVAQKVSEVSSNRKVTKTEDTDGNTGTKEKVEDATENIDEESNKETASVKKTLSMGEAISKSVSQEIQAPAGLRAEISQEWEKYYAEKAE